MKVVVYNTLQEDVKYIREEVFMKEQGFENEFDDLDAISTFVVFYDDTKAVGTGRCYCKDSEYIIGRVAVVKEYRNQGIGKRIIMVLEDVIRSKYGKYVELSAQQRVQKFYEDLGYKLVGDVYYDEYCPHVKMVKKL